MIKLIIFFVVAIIFPGMAGADDPRAREIMQKVEDRYDGESMTSQTLMVLIDKDQNERKKHFVNYRKDYGKDKKNIMFISKPANIKNTGFLTFDFDDSEKDDDQWLFLPALGKTKRIASQDKSGSFMGSDLNYSDMTSRNLEDYDFKLLKETSIRGQKVWLIESIPRTRKVIEETGYKKSIIAVRQDNYFVIMSKSWTEKRGETRLFDVKKLEKIDNIWVAVEIHITKKQGERVKHKTILILGNIKFNQELNDDLFTIRRLEKGL